MARAFFSKKKKEEAAELVASFKAARREAYLAAGGGKRYDDGKRWFRKKKGLCNNRVDATGSAFPECVVDRGAFQQLELFCRSHDITQADLNAAYDAYRHQFEARAHPDGSRKPTNLVSMLYVQAQFENTALEPASLVLVPLLFAKESFGLPKPRADYQINAARFFIAGYAFCAQSPAGLVLHVLRMFLDYAVTIVPVRPFEELVGLLHGGLNRPLLALMREAFASHAVVRFADLVRACVALPPLLAPLWLFQRRLRMKLFGTPFWRRHAAPCLDPATEHLFDAIKVAPSLEARLAGLDSTAAAWRIAARRLCAWAADPLPPSPASPSRWCDVRYDDDQAGPSEASAKLLRDRLGYRLAHFFETLAADPDSPVSFTRAALDDVGRDPPPPPPITFIPIRDAEAGRDFYYSPALGASTWSDPRGDTLFA